MQNVEAMTGSVQLRLLKLLQTREFVRQEGKPAIRNDVRIMASMRGDVQQAVADGKLNPDLYDHLSVFELNVPPLRERREEIPLLLGHFMNRLTRRYGVPARSCSSALLEACQHCAWPGNLRQLEIFVKRFLVLGEEKVAMEELRSQLLSEAVVEARNGDSAENGGHGKHPGDSKLPLKLLVRSAKGEAERNAIAHALEETHWNRKAAARALSISYRALLYKIEEYELIPRDAFLIRGHRNGLRNGSQ